jgi:hypothetical protein
MKGSMRGGLHGYNQGLNPPTRIRSRAVMGRVELDADVGAAGDQHGDDDGGGERADGDVAV